MAKKKQFKVVEKDAKNAPVQDIQWEGEELQANSETKLEQDLGTGQEIVLRFFDFAANPEVFQARKPTGQELFETHKRGMEAILYNDGLAPCTAIEPRLLFSKDKSHYRFVVSCVPSLGNTLVDKTHTLKELLNVS